MEIRAPPQKWFPDNCRDTIQGYSLISVSLPSMIFDKTDFSLGKLDKKKCKMILKFSHKFTMLQKLSKCEVKAWFCWNLIILPSLRFYVKSNFGKFKRPNMQCLAILGLWILIFSTFEQFSSPKFTKIQSSESLK